MSFVDGKAAALAALRERDKGDDMVASFGLRLVDRYSCQRITVPCRRDRCLHHECFDLNSYVAQNRGELLARCPVSISTTMPPRPAQPQPQPQPPWQHGGMPWSWQPPSLPLPPPPHLLPLFVWPPLPPQQALQLPLAQHPLQRLDVASLAARIVTPYEYYERRIRDEQRRERPW